MTTTSTLTRASKISAIRLRDPNFDPSNRTDEYLDGRYEATVEAQPLVGVPNGAPAAKLDESDLSPVTRAQIAAENDRDRARAAISSAPTMRVDEADADLSPVTRAMIAAHNRAEARRGGGFDGSGGDAA